jgi:hypothetical protein
VDIRLDGRTAIAWPMTGAIVDQEQSVSGPRD